MQKLVLPLSPNMDKKIIKYGNDFFFWFISKKEYQNKEFEINNKRQYRFSNFDDLNELQEYLNIIRQLWKKASMVMNHSPNSMSSQELQEEVIWIEENIRPDHYIVKDSFVMENILTVNPNAKLNISSLNMAMNVDDIIYLIKQYGENINRIIFHRDLVASDIDYIIETIENLWIYHLEYEVFAANEWCYNSDWFCSSTHAPEKAVPFVCFREMMFDSPMIKTYSRKKSNCYVCAIFDIKNIDKVTHLKIPWRWHGEETIKLYASFVSGAQNNTSIEQNANLNKRVFGEKFQNMFCKSCIFYKHKEKLQNYKRKD